MFVGSFQQCAKVLLRFAFIISLTSGQFPLQPSCHETRFVHIHFAIILSLIKQNARAGHTNTLIYPRHQCNISPSNHHLG